ncbi:phosphatidylglycerol lysyltransferase domain-containing protein [Nocardioides sp. QY071]|uniref:bifunctional lysylphosphatidylglycerol flippase/synthetase MprF n=1 Tax=Nocardioides sp. QY071 TaxID=3044187 RepID=UPI00249AADC1|nr:phosphatidylglycerol lysyltransferase domain-containing protein [Nocardioides sp. QY071]WGY00611.1 phosphatidylglycerol lysyltransferase domain-containing protein [Nocardioides sp. QY071]
MPATESAVRRRPFTVAGLLLLVIVGVATGAVTGDVLDHGWGRALAYGPDALASGHWWTLLTGPLLAIAPWCYLPVLLSFGLCVGFAEPRLGTVRTGLLWLVTQVGSVVAACLLVLALGPDSLQHARDVGPSGGALGVGAVMTAFLGTAARRVTRTGLVAYVLVSLVLVGHLADVVHLVAVAAGLMIGSVIGPRRRPVVNRDRAVEHLRREGGGTLSWMTTWPGVRYLYDPRGQGYLAYRRHLGVALALGDPIGTPDWRARAAGEFAAFCADEHLVPSHFAVTGPVARAVGGHSLQIGEDTLLDLPDLEFRGKRWQDVRTARNRAARDGIRFELVVLADADPRIVAQVREISDAWLRRQRTPELGFTLGGVDHAMDPRVRVALALDADDRVHGFLSWLPVHAGQGHIDGWTLDLMRRPDDGFRPVIEFLIAESCLAFRAEGARVVSLSAAPLARSTGEPDGWLQRVLERSARVLEPLYGFASLHAFKAKFSPRCETLHLTYRSLAELPRIGAAVLVAYLVTPKTREASTPLVLPERTATERVEAAVRERVAA